MTAVDVGVVRALLDERHVVLASQLEAFVAERIAPAGEPNEDAAARTIARQHLEALGDGGWLAPIAARDLRTLCLVREALGGTSPLADAVFALQALGSLPLVLAGSDGLKRRWLEPALTGRAMAAFAMTEPEAGSDVAAMTTEAAREGDHYVLNGRKWLISNAGIADFYVVFAATNPTARGKGLSCFAVPADAPGLTFVRAQVMSAPHPLGEIAFTNCRVPADALIGVEGDGFRLGLMTLDRLRPTVGAAACGMAARALGEATQHASSRRQFGQALAEFQLVQAKLARMATDLTAARLLVYRAAWEHDLGKDRITLEAAMAKLFATEAAQRAVDDAVQIVGGRGVLADHPVDRLYRAVRALRIYEGTSEIQHLVIARELLRA